RHVRTRSDHSSVVIVVVDHHFGQRHVARVGLFLFMTQHAPSPTLFPYTTLFRSQRDLAVLVDRYNRAVWALRIRRAVPAWVAVLRRVSTRLDSSHVTLSYPDVFLMNHIDVSLCHRVRGRERFARARRQAGSRAHN